MGILLGPNYKPEVASLDDVKIASVVFGATLSICLLTAWKAVEQTRSIIHRGKAGRSWYIWMVWVHLIDNFVLSIVCWLFMDGAVPASFFTFFALLTMWMIQVQLILQIIINRTALIMVNRRHVRMLKWGVVFFIGLINISVYCIWLPARLQISTRFIAINAVWDRIEKIIFLFVDGGLNAYFLYLVKSQLIAGGLQKYQRLFNFNAGIVFVSLSMDILLICMMNLPNSFSYMQFHSLAYITKLYIELIMADLIAKVVRANHIPSYSHSMELDASNNTNSHASKPAHPFDRPPNESFSNAEKNNYVAHISAIGEYQDSRMSVEVLRPATGLRLEGPAAPEFGIQKTVSTVVNSKVDVEVKSTSSSTRELKNGS